MKKAKTLMKHTTNSRVYKMLLREEFRCSLCGPNKGCNRGINRSRDNDSRCWKTYRDNQWK